MTSPTFEQWFATLTGHESPRAWQSDLAAEEVCRDRLIRIPTGLGKTEVLWVTDKKKRLRQVRFGPA